MSIKETQVLERDTLNRAFVSKSATGTQIMAGSLRMLGGLTIDGATNIKTLTAGALTVSSVNASGTITATTFSGSGASLTNLPATSLTGTINVARMPANILRTDLAQTITTNKTFSAAANLYFAGGTTYRIDTSGAGHLSALNVVGTTSSKILSFGNGEYAAPSDTSVGTKIKLWDKSYQIGVETSGIWYDTKEDHKFYTNGYTTTRTLRANISSAGASFYNNVSISEDLEVQGELKTGAVNEFPDPLLASRSVADWSVTNATVTFDSVQKPAGLGTVGSIKIAATAADATISHGKRYDASPGQFMTLSFYAFATTSGVSGQARILWYKSDATASTAKAQDLATFTYATGWARVSLKGQAPADASYCTIRLDNDGGASKVVYIAAIQMEHGRATTNFKGYIGTGDAISLYGNHLRLGVSGEIHSPHNDSYIIKDHDNGNVTLSATGSDLYLGYTNTSKVLLSSPLFTSSAATMIASTDGKLYYQGDDINSRFVNATGGTINGTINIATTTAGTMLNLEVNAEVAADFRIGHASYAHVFRFTGNEAGNANSLELYTYNGATMTNKVFRIQQDGIMHLDQLGATIAGNAIWHTGNDGAGSGLNADKLDDLEASQFIRSDASDTKTGTLTLSTNSPDSLKLYRTSTTGNIGIHYYNTLNGFNAGAAVVSSSEVYFAVSESADLSAGKFKVRSTTGETTINGNKVWHEGNDGTGSGLDADLLDGVQASSFLRNDADATTTGSVTISNDTLYPLKLNSAGINRGKIGIEFNGYSNHLQKGYLTASHKDSDSPFGVEEYSFHVGSTTDKTAFVLDSPDGNFYVGTNKVWHLGNDGADSGLDADLLDGLESSSFLRSDQDGLINGDLGMTGTPYLSGVNGAYREGGELNLLSRLNGRVINKNPDFITGTTAGYSIYDNNDTGRLLMSIVSDDTVPNATGSILRIDYDPARNATTGSTPGFGGFTTKAFRTTGNPNDWGYRAGNRYLVRIVAKIPVGRTISWAQNSTGSDGGFKYMSSRSGTGDWQEYLLMWTVGQTGTFNGGGYFHLSGGDNIAFLWDVAICQFIGLDEVADTDRASTLNIGYKKGVNLDWGQLHATGKITTDSSINAASASISGAILATGSLTGSKLNITASSGSIELGSNSAANTPYVDFHSIGGNKDYDVRMIASGGSTTADGAGTLTVHAGNVITAKDLEVAGTLTIRKTGNYSTIAFPAQTNDPGFIRHYENNNVAQMEFSVSDDANDADYFSFGATPSNVFTEGARITAAGNATFKATTLSSVSVSGNATVSNRLTTARGDGKGVYVGASRIQEVGAGELLLIADEIRFGATSSTWSYNEWGGIKFNHTLMKMTIGGATSADFKATTGPSNISISFEGTDQTSFDGKVLINAGGSTIGGQTMANGHVLIGTATSGLALDPNEIYFAGGAGIIGTIGAHSLSFRPNASEVMNIAAAGVTVLGTLTSSGNISGSRVTASGGVSVPSGQNIYIGTYGSATAALRLHYNGTDSYMDYNTDLQLRAGTATKATLTAAGNFTLVGSMTSAGVTSSGNIAVSGSGKGITFNAGNKIWQTTDNWMRFDGPIFTDANVIRTDGELQVGGSGATLRVINGSTFNFRDTLWADGSHVAIGKTAAAHPLDVKTELTHEGINLQTGDDALTNGLSFQNSGGTYAWHMARVGTNANPDLVFYGGPYQTTMSNLAEKVRFRNGGGIDSYGDMLLDNGTNTTLTIKSGDTGKSSIELYGSAQGTGYVYVGQSLTHGGGIEYNGDGSPVTTGAGADYISLFRRSASADHWTARNSQANNDWEFRGAIVTGGMATIGGNLNLTGTQIGMGNDTDVIVFNDSNDISRVNAYTNNDSVDFKGDGSITNTVIRSGNVDASDTVYAHNKVVARKFGMEYNEAEDSLDFVYYG